MRAAGRDSSRPAPGRREGGTQADWASDGPQLPPTGPLRCLGRGSVERGQGSRPRRAGGGEHPIRLRPGTPGSAWACR